MERDRGTIRKRLKEARFGFLAMLLVSGCVFGPDDAGHVPLPDEAQAVELKAIRPEQARVTCPPSVGQVAVTRKALEVRILQLWIARK